MPALPPELEHLWGYFRQLNRRRQSGMSPNPITYQDIEAFERRSLVKLTAWETDVLIRVDDAVIAAWRNDSKPKTQTDTPSDPVPVTDTTNMKALFRGLATRKKQQIAAQKGGSSG